MSVSQLRDIIAIEHNEGEPFSRLTSTYEMIRDTAAANPEAPALSFFLRTEDYADPARWTYREWLADVTRAANMLRRLGVQPGDVVAYVLPNLPETHLAVWGAETAGIAFAVNSLLESAQLGQLLQAARTRWVITTGPTPDDEIWRRVEAALPAVDSVQGILAVDLARHLPGRPPGSASPTRAAGLPDTLAGIPVLDFHVELGKASGAALDFVAPQAQDVASYFCTGGTTGLPKIALHTHRNETANAIQLGRLAAAHFLGPGITVLTALPLFHVNAQLGTGLAVFAHGGHLLLGPPAGYRAPGLIPRFWEIIAHHRVSSFSGVPTVFAGLLQAPRAGHDLSCLSLAICGGAPMPVELFRKFESETGMRILEGYGLTESSCVASLNPPDGESRIGSIGMRIPWEEMRVLILDGDGRYQRDAEVDEPGVIALNGPNVFTGYLDPAHDAGAWLERPSSDGTQRWLNTGDLGRMDGDGYFWLTGRKKELIIRGGHNIDPKSIEEVLAGHPAVEMSAAVGRPDPHAGEVPVAYVQLRPGVTVEEAELLRFAGEHIAERSAAPKAVIIVPALPVTAVGKIFKPTLNMREIESVVRTEAIAAGVELAELRVEQDPQIGLIARYRATGDAAALAAALGRYAFKSQSL